MKIYLALIRIALFWTAFGFLGIGVLFYMQNWEGWRLMLGVGAAFSAIILIDLLMAKKVIS